MLSHPRIRTLGEIHLRCFDVKSWVAECHPKMERPEKNKKKYKAGPPR